MTHLSRWWYRTVVEGGGKNAIGRVSGDGLESIMYGGGSGCSRSSNVLQLRETCSCVHIYRDTCHIVISHRRLTGDFRCEASPASPSKNEPRDST